MRAVYPLMIVMLLSACDASSGVALAPAAKADSAAEASQSRGAGSGASGPAQAAGAGQPADTTGGPGTVRAAGMQGAGSKADSLKSPTPLAAARGANLSAAGDGLLSIKDASVPDEWTPESIRALGEPACRASEDRRAECTVGAYDVQVSRAGSCDGGAGEHASIGEATIFSKPVLVGGKEIGKITGWGLACLQGQAYSKAEGEIWSYVVLVPASETEYCRTNKARCRFTTPLKIILNEKSGRPCHIVNDRYTDGCVRGWVRSGAVI